MNQTKIPVLSHFEPRTRQQILAKEPLISSLGWGWSDFKFDYYQHSKHETPVYIAKHHVLVLALNSIKTKRKLDGVYGKEEQNFGSVAIIPAKVEHYCAWKTTGKFIVLSFTPQALAKIAPETIDVDKIELLPRFSQSEPDRVITGIGIGIKQQLEIDPNNCDFYVEHLKNALLAHLLKNYCTVEHSPKNFDDGLPPYKLKQAIDYINDNLDQQIKLTDIAELVDISQYYFCRLFSESIGISPYKYVIQQRVAKAKDLIKNSNFTLADISYECGFSSQSQMTQHFRKCVGVTPKVYRNKL